MTHLQDELAHRGLPVEKFKVEPDRIMAAAKRLEISPIGIKWLEDYYNGVS